MPALFIHEATGYAFRVLDPELTLPRRRPAAVELPSTFEDRATFEPRATLLRRVVRRVHRLPFRAVSPSLALADSLEA